jgi:uncharacterized protein YciI
VRRDVAARHDHASLEVTMTAELPPDLVIETIWVLEATYAPGALEARRPFRAEHASRLAAFREQGLLLEAGGYLDGSTALLLFRVPDQETALRLARDDVYMREGIWVELRCRAFGRVARADEVAG